MFLVLELLAQSVELLLPSFRSNLLKRKTELMEDSIATSAIRKDDKADRRDLSEEEEVSEEEDGITKSNLSISFE